MENATVNNLYANYAWWMVVIGFFETLLQLITCQLQSYLNDSNRNVFASVLKSTSFKLAYYFIFNLFIFWQQLSDFSTRVKLLLVHIHYPIKLHYFPLMTSSKETANYQALILPD